MTTFATWEMQTNFREPICPRTRLYLTLRYLATVDKMSSIAFAFRIGNSTASAIIADTCECLWNVLQNEMFIPSEDNWKEIAKEFYTRWNFSHCIGEIDGKHVVTGITKIRINVLLTIRGVTA